ncbi:MAG: tryptophan synthase subunit alpha, partial [Candidatus Omnitrophica bacterium]|nr:tryptophan synthase subunit alpha [Candidatus Omnitrophota bacterium]
EASQYGLERGVHLQDILGLIKKVRQSVDTPICLMTYYNPVFCFGDKKFAGAAAASGVDGLIIPDLPAEEGKAFIRLMSGFGLDVILFLAPTTTLKRSRFISRLSRGFIYYVSLTGVTGVRQGLPAGLCAKLKKVKRITSKPVCVGFGVSGPKQSRQIYKIADGAIVGSAVVKKIKQNLQRKDLVKKVSAFVSTLKDV